MRTFEETIRREAEIAHSAGYMGEPTSPLPERVRMIAEIYGVSSTRVKREIEEAVGVLTYGSIEAAKEVAEAMEESRAKIREEGRLHREEIIKYGHKAAIKMLYARMRKARAGK
jgi:hypothetical protein